MGFTDTELLTLVAAVERFSEHPLAAAIVAGAQDRGLQLPEATGFDSIFDNPNFAGGGTSLFLRQSIRLTGTGVALTKLDENGLSEADRSFYAGKPAVARFFVSTVLPELAARRQVAEAIDNALMDVPESAF